MTSVKIYSHHDASRFGSNRFIQGSLVPMFGFELPERHAKRERD